MTPGTVLLELLLSLARVRGRGLRLFGVLRGRFRVLLLRLLGEDGRQSGENSEPSYQYDAEYSSVLLHLHLPFQVGNMNR